MAANYQIVQGYFNRSGIFRKGFTKISEGLPSNRVHPEVKTDWASPMKPTFFGGLKNLNLEVTIQRKLGNSFHIQVHSPYLMASSPSILKVKGMISTTLVRFIYQR
ncbi:unnamed protein product [Cuscuta campestris]|uniref:Uncharacterized protein n=1 Tax=Cuscuta campestris TaxID=132261 RepID=A0A484LDV3_9ASTE|nr:unnamed protein product [Cuscuta campestris]